VAPTTLTKSLVLHEYHKCHKLTLGSPAGPPAPGFINYCDFKYISLFCRIVVLCQHLWFVSLFLALYKYVHVCSLLSIMYSLRMIQTDRPLSLPTKLRVCHIGLLVHGVPKHEVTTRGNYVWLFTSSKRLNQFAWFLAHFNAVLFWTQLLILTSSNLWRNWHHLSKVSDLNFALYTTDTGISA